MNGPIMNFEVIFYAYQTEFQLNVSSPPPSWPAAELGPGARSGDHTQATASLLGVYLLDIYWLIFKQRAEQSKTH